MNIFNLILDDISRGSNILESNRNKSLDMIKVVAMLGVIGLHTIYYFNLGDTFLGHIIYSISGLSIPLFFMCSGYLMFGKNNNYNYFIKKSFKIVKFIFLYIFAVELLLNNVNFSLSSYLSNTVNSFFQHGPYFYFWYFTTVVLLYISTPFLEKYVLRRKFLLILCLALLMFILGFVYSLNLTNLFEYNIPQPLRLYTWFFYYLFGGLVHYLHTKTTFLKFGFIKNKFFILLILYILYSLLFFEIKKELGQYGIEYMFGSSSCIILSSMVFLIFITSEIKINYLMTMVSNLFLPVYALHMFVIRIFYKLFLNIQFNNEIKVLVLYTLIAFFTILSSFLIMKIPVVSRLFRI